MPTLNVYNLFNMCGNDARLLQRFIWKQLGLVHVGQDLLMLALPWQTIFDRQVFQKSFCLLSGQLWWFSEVLGKMAGARWLPF